MIFWLCVVAWCSIGVFSLIMDWTYNYDLHLDDLLEVAICGCIMGPFALTIWYSTVHKGKKLLVMRKRR